MIPATSDRARRKAGSTQRSGGGARRCQAFVGLGAGLLASTLVAALQGPPALASGPTVLAISYDPNGAVLDAVAPVPPFTVIPGLATTDGSVTVRHFFGRHYLVKGPEGSVEVLDPETSGSLLEFSVGSGSDPRDILLVRRGMAYVSRFERAQLLKVDPRTGAELGTIDLSGYADRDGIPEMNMMALDGARLFIQIQRLDHATGMRSGPSVLAVIDTITDTPVDADPVSPGLQGIELLGTIPVHRMHVNSAARRLFVCAPGERLEVLGGIEEIDLDALASLGFILPEVNGIGDLGPFVMISADEGFAVGHTDIVASSHLFRFHRDGTVGGELDVTFETLRGIEYDPATGYLFFPDPNPNFMGGPPGVTVWDTIAERILSQGEALTSGPVLDVVLAADAAGSPAPPRPLGRKLPRRPGRSQPLR